jgi:ABC-type microcin C transport system permease subunit YejE
MSERSLGYKVLGVLIFAGIPSALVGLIFSIISPLGGVLLGALVFGFCIDVLRPRADRDEKW